jgi:hypothetical protein
MPKAASYFSHDSNARNDEKILAMRIKYGMEGYGVFFSILERMRDTENYIHVKDYNIIAFDLRVNNALVKSIVEDFGLFEFTDDGNSFYSVNFLERMNKKDETTKKLSEAGKCGGGNPNFKKGVKNPYYQDDKGKDNCLDKGKDKPPLSVEINKKSKVKKSKLLLESSIEDSLSTGKPADAVGGKRESNVPSEQRIDYAKFIDWFISETKGVFGKPVYPLSKMRQDSIRARIREHGKKALFEVVKKAFDSDFLKGDNNRGFKATLDWLIKPSNFDKVLSGNYDNKKKDDETGRQKEAEIIG